MKRKSMHDHEMKERRTKIQILEYWRKCRSRRRSKKRKMRLEEPVDGDDNNDDNYDDDNDDDDDYFHLQMRGLLKALNSSYIGPSW